MGSINLLGIEFHENSIRVSGKDKKNKITLLAQFPSQIFLPESDITDTIELTNVFDYINSKIDLNNLKAKIGLPPYMVISDKLHTLESLNKIDNPFIMEWITQFYLNSPGKAYISHKVEFREEGDFSFTYSICFLRKKILTLLHEIKTKYKLNILSISPTYQYILNLVLSTNSEWFNSNFVLIYPYQNNFQCICWYNQKEDITFNFEISSIDMLFEELEEKLLNFNLSLSVFDFIVCFEFGNTYQPEIVKGLINKQLHFLNLDEQISLSQSVKEKVLVQSSLSDFLGAIALLS